MCLAVAVSAFAVIGSILMMGLPATAQVNTSTIAGNVTDESGSVVPNAVVTVTQASTGLVRKVTVSSNGEYAIPQLAPGRYEVKAEAQGFQTGVATAVNVDIAQRARLDFTLKVGMVSQQVEVSAQAEVMDTDTASLEQPIEQRTVKDLPLNGRNYLRWDRCPPV